MTNDELKIQLNKYLDDNWEQMVQDIADLVAVPSYAYPEHKTEEFPTGKEPA